MLGTLITAALGYGAFRAGMSAQRLHAEGKGAGEIAKIFVQDACAAARHAGTCVKNLITHNPPGTIAAAETTTVCTPQTNDETANG